MIFPTRVQLELKYHTRILSEYKKKMTFFFFIIFYCRHCCGIFTTICKKLLFYWYIIARLVGLVYQCLCPSLMKSLSHTPFLSTECACTSTNSSGSSECWLHTGHTCRIGKQGQWSWDTLYR